MNNTNNKSYVGKSVNLYQRLSKYLSKTYIQKTKNKMAICSAIDKYGIDNFTLYILETITVLSTDKPSLAAEGDFIKLRDKENYWYNLIAPSYNIQAILQPFTGTNHYRFGSTLPEEIKLKISNTLKGRVVS